MTMLQLRVMSPNFWFSDNVMALHLQLLFVIQILSISIQIVQASLSTHAFLSSHAKNPLQPSLMWIFSFSTISSCTSGLPFSSFNEPMFISFCSWKVYLLAHHLGHQANFDKYLYACRILVEESIFCQKNHLSLK